MSKRTQILIDNKLYDVTNFLKIHPGGDKIIEEFDQTDATDYFYLIHSNKAREMLSQLKYQDINHKDMVPRSDILNLAFKLEEQGFFKHNPWIEALQISHCLGWMILATLLRNMYPFIAAICLGLGILMGGWIGHTFDHQRNNILKTVNFYFATIFLGTSPTWWAAKHTRHHLNTNELGLDSDIELMPIFFLWKPKKENDSWNRRFQHIYFIALYSILQLKWEYDALIHTITNKKYFEFSLLCVHWVWFLFVLPWKVWLSGVLIGGTLLAWVVTSNHQAEVKLEGKRTEGEKSGSKYKIRDLAVHQITTTRNIYCDNWATNLLCGGLQYQIEHHLFPRMPIYRLPIVRGIIMDYCKEHNLEYLQDTCFDMIKKNFENMKTFAQAKVQQSNIL